MILRVTAAGIAILGAFLLADATPVIRFVDIAASAGLTLPVTYGGKQTNTVILESTGTGAAILTTTAMASMTFSLRMEPRWTPTPRRRIRSVWIRFPTPPAPPSAIAWPSPPMG